MLSAAVELLGLACFVVAGWLVAPALGMAVAGAGLLLVGQALDSVPLSTLTAVLDTVRARWRRRSGPS